MKSSINRGLLMIPIILFSLGLVGIYMWDYSPAFRKFVSGKPLGSASTHDNNTVIKPQVLVKPPTSSSSATTTIPSPILERKDIRSEDKWLTFTGAVYHFQIPFDDHRFGPFQIRIPQGWEVRYMAFDLAKEGSESSGKEERVVLSKDGVEVRVARFVDWDSGFCFFGSQDPGSEYYSYPYGRIPKYYEFTKKDVIWRRGLDELNGNRGIVCEQDKVRSYFPDLFHSVTKIGFITFSVPDEEHLDLVDEVINGIDVL